MRTKVIRQQHKVKTFKFECSAAICTTVSEYNIKGEEYGVTG